ncbi:unnamed protein product [Dibothriocephalus latus]|uniref:Histone H4 n=1 Tax=Dibothriocephalus latus TaxID=60516 RepID=A0A3P7L532_DIBLA|nr:unnamed protein product [Dibothriocephalus latus]
MRLIDLIRGQRTPPNLHVLAVGPVRVDGDYIDVNSVSCSRLLVRRLTRCVFTDMSGRGRGGVKRPHRALRDNIQGTTKPTIRPLVRREVGKRISAFIYEETCDALEFFLKNVICDAVTHRV